MIYDVQATYVETDGEGPVETIGGVGGHTNKRDALKEMREHAANGAAHVLVIKRTGDDPSNMQSETVAQYHA